MFPLIKVMQGIGYSAVCLICNVKFNIFHFTLNEYNLKCQKIY